MKPKGISFLELHCEKIFLLIMAVAALAVIALQFTGEGNTVSVGSGNEYRLDRAYEQIASEAEAKLGQLEQTNPHPSAPAPDTDYAQRFAAAIDAPVAPLASAPLARPYNTLGGTLTPTDGDLLVAEVAVGAPSRPETAVFLGSVSPSADLASEYDAIYGEDGGWPRDVRAVTVQTTYNAAALRDRLESDPDGSGPAVPTPAAFWNGRHFIASLVFERQRQTAPGEWSEPETLPPPPGAIDLNELIAAMSEGEPNPDQVAEALALIKGDRGWELVRPGFVTTSPSGQWSPPLLADEQDPEAARARLDQLISRGPNLREIAEVPLWTHDYNVEPGATYRYRAQVWLPNPYYGFGPAIAEEARDLADSPFIKGDPSPWSAPVTAPRMTYWYAFSATDGEEGEVVAEASCRLDVFGFVGGRWRRVQQRFAPGAPVRVTLEAGAGATRLVDTGARVLDVVPAPLSEPDARGRQTPIQVVAATADGLAVREVWRDRADARRRELLAEIAAADEAAAPAPAEPRERPAQRPEPRDERPAPDRRGGRDGR